MSMLCMTLPATLRRTYSTHAPWTGRSRCGRLTVFQSASNPACKQVPQEKEQTWVGWAEEQQALSMSQSPSGSCCSKGASCMLGM